MIVNQEKEEVLDTEEVKAVLEEGKYEWFCSALQSLKIEST